MASSIQSVSTKMWTPPSARLSPLTDADKDDLEQICQRELDPSLLPLADRIEQRVPMYDAAELSKLITSSSESRISVLDELHRALSVGPGLFVIQGLISADLMDRVDKASEEIHQTWPAQGGGKQSMRTSAFVEKLALKDPETYAEYFGNEVLATAAEAWLGPAYRIYADLNSVTQGNVQPIHRDYPLSHLPTDRIPSYPVLSQMSSQYQTLQGAVAHTDMSLETGPTRLAPFSHQFQKGYMAIGKPDFMDIADRHMSQLPLKRGDAIIFNPACFHQPGLNTTDSPRQACLFQIASPWTIQMVLLDRAAMTKSVWPVMKRWAKEIDDAKSSTGTGGEGTKRTSQLEALIAATCDDFAYPFNWRASHSDQTQAQMIRAALDGQWEEEKVMQALDSIDASKRL